MLWWFALLVGEAWATAAPTLAPTTPTMTPTTGKPTMMPTPFVIPKLPIDKSGASYPDCKAEIIFVLDVSGSVSVADQEKLMRFTTQFMVEVEKNVGDVRFGVVIFGIQSADSASGYKTFATSAINPGGPLVTVNGPFGNQKRHGTNLELGLDYLRYNCTECGVANANFSQLEYMWTLYYWGGLTPTWDGLEFARSEYERSGDKTVPGRFIVLLTDGVPNDNDCSPYVTTNPTCVRSVNLTDTAVEAATEGTLLLTVGLKLTNDTKPLMIRWASQPKDVLSIPEADFATLQSLIPKILAVLCPGGAGVECLEEDAKKVDVVGSPSSAFLNTADLTCRFYRDEDGKEGARYIAAIYVNTTFISCPIPANFYPGTWNMEYTQDGRGFYPAARFKFGTVCRPQLLVIWWPFCALALLPLAFCRPKKIAPVTTTKVTRGVARAAPAATEEYEEYEEVEEIVQPPEPVNKWKVAPTAYIGFGRARMSVDWAGVAPESAPHEGVRKKVVKKVVSDHAPVPTAGPYGVPAPAVQEAPSETVTTQSKPPIVEEPDWVNSFMDKVAAVVCCCCNKK